MKIKHTHIVRRRLQNGPSSFITITKVYETENGEFYMLTDRNHLEEITLEEFNVMENTDK